jgi:flagellar biosynthesis protein FliQ
MVITTACSPEIARLSIWMSLCGLRPMVVRSLIKGISLSIVVSMLSMSLAIVVVLQGHWALHYLNQASKRDHQPRAAG